MPESLAAHYQAVTGRDVQARPDYYRALAERALILQHACAQAGVDVEPLQALAVLVAEYDLRREELRAAQDV